MPVGDDTHAYRGRLPHLTKPSRMYFVTFCTRNRKALRADARSLVLQSCVYDHESLCWIDCVVVMPDHVHLIVTPYQAVSLAVILQRMKSASAFRVNRLLGRAGALWQRESFDRILRSNEKLEQKRQSIFENPVRAGLVEKAEE
ncbi:MAG TPA: transposase, partial [Thermoanaerobaculia bacterium]